MDAHARCDVNVQLYRIMPGSGSGVVWANLHKIFIYCYQVVLDALCQHHQWSTLINNFIFFDKGCQADDDLVASNVPHKQLSDVY